MCCKETDSAVVMLEALFIGYGNSLRADDGAGLAVIEKLTSASANVLQPMRAIDFVRAINAGTGNGHRAGPSRYFCGCHHGASAGTHVHQSGPSGRIQHAYGPPFHTRSLAGNHTTRIGRMPRRGWRQLDANPSRSAINSRQQWLPRWITWPDTYLSACPDGHASQDFCRSSLWTQIRHPWLMTEIERIFYEYQTAYNN